MIRLQRARCDGTAVKPRRRSMSPSPSSASTEFYRLSTDDDDDTQKERVPCMETPADLSPVKWLTLDRSGGLHIHLEANDILEAEDRNINAIVTFGAARSGKSYFQNALLGCSCFEVSSAASRCTAGVDICRQLVPAAHFSGDASGGPLVAMIDVEGHSFKNSSKLMNLCAPLLLVAKVAIFYEVCPVGPSPDRILRQLQNLMHAAKLAENRHGRRHLHVVLRDCFQDEEVCRQIIFDKEDPDNADSEEHAAAIRMRNLVRDDIAVCFEALPQVSCLPKLAEETAPSNLKAMPPAFARKIEVIRTQLGDQLKFPRLLYERPLTGLGISAVIESVAEALNKEEVRLSSSPNLNLSAIMSSAFYIEAQHTVCELLANAKQQFVELEGTLLPISEAQLQNYILGVRRSKERELFQRLGFNEDDEGAAPHENVLERVRMQLVRGVEAQGIQLLALNAEWQTQRQLQDAFPSLHGGKLGAVQALLEIGLDFASWASNTVPPFPDLRQENQ